MNIVQYGSQYNGEELQCGREVDNPHDPQIRMLRVFIRQNYISRGFRMFVKYFNNAMPFQNGNRAPLYYPYEINFTGLI